MLSEGAMSIREVADACGVSVRALRYYEQIGLIRPNGRNLSGQRYYSPEIVGDVQVICAYKRMGFRLRDIPGFCEKCSNCGECTRPGLDHTTIMWNLLEARKRRITKLISSLQGDLARVEHGLAVLRQEPRKASCEPD